MVYTIPKYTQYQLSQKVKAVIKKENLSINEISLKYDVNLNLIDDILQEHVIFKAKHYEVVSIVLGLSINELLADEVIKPISFRSKHEENDQDINREIKKISDFFVEVALLKKINGGTYVKN
ncbi:hypothetical protein CWR48_04980 [Oceanobacillus arenosus]|uniref:Uncharacterized protein n=1 Tax=Oceanobacillus arenosus TaxID=1229153 RepID=A0A3D8PV93_9BACI|nr:hypothetical protein [Oceanobacillus arenosus]RDW20080.1 hypothetical protein CWR48_04980 [Oceanobacillus arenosus]